MGKVVRASALILLLTCSARAGYIPYGVSEPLPPPPTNGIQQEVPTTNGHMQKDAAESLTETLLSVLESLSALF